MVNVGRCFFVVLAGYYWQMDSKRQKFNCSGEMYMQDGIRIIIDLRNEQRFFLSSDVSTFFSTTISFPQSITWTTFETSRSCTTTKTSSLRKPLGSSNIACCQSGALMRWSLFLIISTRKINDNFISDCFPRFGVLTSNLYPGCLSLPEWLVWG